MNITLEIKAPELAQAIQSLANALSSRNGIYENVVALASEGNKEVAPTVQPNVAPVHQEAPIQQQAPTYQPPVQQPMQQAPTQLAVPTSAPPVQQPPVQQQAPTQQQQGVPTSAPSYDMNQLAVAATQLMDAGRQADLLSLLGAFGAQSLMELPKEQYGAFATKLRELGAKI